MRLKVFTAGTLAKAMAEVRREMGEKAIIVSTQMDAGGARVTAALEEPEPTTPLAKGAEGEWEDVTQDLWKAAHDDREAATAGDIEEEIRQALNFHGVPLPLTQRLVRAAAMVNGTGALMALAGAFDRTFGFAPLSNQATARPLMLIGPPGAGKTLTVAKLATQARRAGRMATIITTDTRRAGGIEQLQAFTRILKIELLAAATPAELAAILSRRDEAIADGPVLIDTAGANPFIGGDIARLCELVDIAAAEAVLVLPAGGDAMEMMDTAAAFTPLRVRRLLATRLDAVRRLGGLLAAVDAGRTSFSDAGISHRVADSLVPLNPVALSRAILPHAGEKPPSSPFSETFP
jgi:flagellar biosynthesis protein FlhF